MAASFFLIVMAASFFLIVMVRVPMLFLIVMARVPMLFLIVMARVPMLFLLMVVAPFVPAVFGVGAVALPSRRVAATPLVAWRSVATGAALLPWPVSMHSPRRSLRRPASRARRHFGLDRVAANYIDLVLLDPGSGP